jgi:DNA-binding NarL/FixJ family response regulator
VTLTGAPRGPHRAGPTVPGCGGSDRYGVLIVSRAPLVTAGIRAWIQTATPAAHIAGIVSTACEFRTGWRDTSPDVVVLVSDTKAPSLLTVVHQEADDARILVLASRCEVRDEVSFMRRGASGVLDVCCPYDDFIRALELVRRGRAAVSAAAVRALAVADSCEVLTSRQREILDLLNDGVRPREIAERLVISPNTVKTHMFRMRRRLRDDDAQPTVNGHR